MRTQSMDTPPHIEEILIEGLRRMSAGEKLQRVFELNALLETLAMSDVRKRHPEADEYECRLRVASRRIPADLMLKAFGWNVEEKG